MKWSNKLYRSALGLMVIAGLTAACSQQSPEGNLATKLDGLCETTQEEIVHLSKDVTMPATEDFGEGFIQFGADGITDANDYKKKPLGQIIEADTITAQLRNIEVTMTTRPKTENVVEVDIYMDCKRPDKAPQLRGIER